jgi:hypothetical protein
MRRTLSVCAALVALSLVVSQQARAEGASNVKGTYAFTLAEKCVQVGDPGFDPTTFKIPNPPNPQFGFTSAITYGGASDGLMVVDGRGGVSIQKGRATNVMNAPEFLTPGSIPLGIGFGPAIPFTCVGNYTVVGGEIAANLTCNATISPSNPANAGSSNPFTGFQSVFTMEGSVPQNPFHLLLTDIGNTVQKVTIFKQDKSMIFQNRICTRSTTLDRVSGPDHQ